MITFSCQIYSCHVCSSTSQGLNVVIEPPHSPSQYEIAQSLSYAISVHLCRSGFSRLQNCFFLSDELFSARGKDLTAFQLVNG